MPSVPARGPSVTLRQSEQKRSLETTEGECENSLRWDSQGNLQEPGSDLPDLMQWVHMSDPTWLHESLPGDHLGAFYVYEGASWVRGYVPRGAAGQLPPKVVPGLTQRIHQVGGPDGGDPPALVGRRPGSRGYLFSPVQMMDEAWRMEVARETERELGEFIARQRAAGIVDERLWDEAELLQKRARKLWQCGKSIDTLRCGECGNAMVCEEATFSMMCHQLICPTCARARADKFRAEFHERLPEFGHFNSIPDFALVHIITTTPYDPAFEGDLTTEAFGARAALCLEDGKKIVQNVLKRVVTDDGDEHVDRRCMAFVVLECGDHGMVHAHILAYIPKARHLGKERKGDTCRTYRGYGRDAGTFRIPNWLADMEDRILREHKKRFPHATQVRVKEVQDPVEGATEVFNYITKSTSPKRADHGNGDVCTRPHPTMVARLNFALYSMQVVRRYGRACMTKEDREKLKEKMQREKTVECCWCGADNVHGDCPRCRVNMKLWKTMLAVLGMEWWEWRDQRREKRKAAAEDTIGLQAQPQTRGPPARAGP